MPASKLTNLQRILIQPDFGQMSEEDLYHYYIQVCESLKLNPQTRPLAYIRLNGRTVLYATKDCCDQLRKIYNISIEIVSKELTDDILVVVVRARDEKGRIDEDLSALNVKGLTGDNLANAMMKAITKAKRRVTLSICGLGIPDETELETVRNLEYIDNAGIHERIQKNPHPVVSVSPDEKVPPTPTRTETTTPLGSAETSATLESSLDRFRDKALQCGWNESVCTLKTFFLELCPGRTPTVRNLEEALRLPTEKYEKTVERLNYALAEILSEYDAFLYQLQIVPSKYGMGTCDFLERMWGASPLTLDKLRSGMKNMSELESAALELKKELESD